VKKFLILSLIVIAAGVFVAFQLAQDPGYVLIVFRGWSFETSVFALLVALLVIVVVLRLLWSLVSWPVQLFKSTDKRS